MIVYYCLIFISLSFLDSSCLIFPVHPQAKESQIGTDIPQGDAYGYDGLITNLCLVLLHVYGLDCQTRKLLCRHALLYVLVGLPELLACIGPERILRDIGLHIAWHDVGDLDAMPMQLGSHRIEYANQGVLRPGIGGPVCSAQFPLHAGDADYLPRFVFNHVGQHGLHMHEGPINIHIEHAEVIVEVVVLELATHRHPCVLDYYIEFLPSFLQLSYHLRGSLPYCLVVSHVEFKNLHFLLILTVLLHLLQLLLVPGTYYEGSPTATELIGQVLSDPRGGTRNPDVLAAVVGLAQSPSHNFDYGVDKE